MSKDIYIDTTAISSSVLKDVIANLETAQRKLSSMSTVGSLSRLSYRDLNGLHSLFTTDIGYDAVAVAGDVSAVLEEVRRYAGLMNSVSISIVEIDDKYGPVDPEKYVNKKLYSKVKDWTAGKLESKWEKITGHDLDRDIYLTFIEDILFEFIHFDQVDGFIDNLETIEQITVDISSGNISMATVSGLYKVYSKGVNEILDSPLTPVELKLVSHTIKASQKYADIEDGYREVAVKKFINGDYWALPVYLGQSLVLLGKAVTDVAAQTIIDVFMLEEAGTLLSMITGYDETQALEDFGTAVNDYVDVLFGM